MLRRVKQDPPLGGKQAQAPAFLENAFYSNLPQCFCLVQDYLAFQDGAGKI
jgi:hypothetical protein